MNTVHYKTQCSLASVSAVPSRRQVLWGSVTLTRPPPFDTRDTSEPAGHHPNLVGTSAAQGRPRHVPVCETRTSDGFRKLISCTCSIAVAHVTYRPSLSETQLQSGGCQLCFSQVELQVMLTGTADSAIVETEICRTAFRTDHSLVLRACMPSAPLSAAESQVRTVQRKVSSP